MTRRLMAGLCVGFALACATTPPAPQPVLVPPPAPPPAQPPTPAAALVDREGDSPQTAVPVPKDAPNEGIDFQNNWIYDHFGRFRRLSWALANSSGRHYKLIKFELPDHSEHTVYFDVTEIWEAWTPQPK
jgi:hypothetical protein